MRQDENYQNTQERKRCGSENLYSLDITFLHLLYGHSFFTTGSRTDTFGLWLIEMDENRANGIFLIVFGLMIFSMVWIFILSAKRFDLFGQSPYTALWMIFIPAAPVIYLYLAFKKDLYYVKERENM